MPTTLSLLILHPSMSRRQPNRAAKRARSPLVELSPNHADLEEKYPDPPNLSLLSLASEQVAADENQPPAPKQRKKRGKYHPRLTTEQRKEILTMWVSEGQDAPHIIAHFARKGTPIARSTIDNIIRRVRDEDRIELKLVRTVRRTKYGYEEYKVLADIQEQHHQWTYDQVRAEWKLWWSGQHNGGDAPTPSNFTLAKALDMFNKSTKNLEWVPETRNDDEHIEWRFKYCTEAINWTRGNLIFVDETGFNKHIHRKRGRSAKGTRAHALETNSAGPRINLCAAVSTAQGLVKYKCILTSYNTAEFANFMQELLETPLLQTRSCIICMDNVSWHHVDEVHDVLRANRIEHRIKRIPSYSPHLNPIEYAFAIWKNAIKRVDQLTTAITLQQQIDNAAPLITDQLISRCLDHVYRYYVHCIQRKPLEKFHARLQEDGEVVMGEPEDTAEEKEREV